MTYSILKSFFLGLALLLPQVSLAGLQFSERQLHIKTDVDGPEPFVQIEISGIAATEPWVAAPDVDWLEIAPSQGRGPALISLRVRSEALPAGDYSARLYARTANSRVPLEFVQLSYQLDAAQGVSVVSGSGQRGVRGQRLSRPLVASVRDAEGNPLAGVEVSFRTIAGKTEPASLSLISDANGLVSYQPRALDYGALVVHAEADVPGAAARFSGIITGYMSTFAGDGIRAYGGDGGPATQAHLNAPFGMAFLDDKFLLVDYFNHALRQIDTRTGRIDGLAGTGRQGFNGDGLPARESLLSGPFGLALGRQNEVIFSDYYNHRIRRIRAQDGSLETLAGNGVAGYSGDGGPGPDASIDVPLDIATDSRGNVYLSDWHHQVVRRIDADTGQIHRVAGTGARTFNGDGPALGAALSVPLGLSFDEQDNLYIADYGNNRVRRVDARTGRMSTVAGTGERGFSGDGGPALFARLNRPYNVYADRRKI